MSPIVTIDPDNETYPEIRRGGKYGPGCPNPADCTLVGFIHSTKLTSEDAPPFDRELERGPYHKFTFKIVEPDQTVYHDEWCEDKKKSRSKALPFLKGAGVPVDANGSFDTDSVAPRKVVLEFGDPKAGKKDPSRKFVKLLKVYSLGA